MCQIETQVQSLGWENPLEKEMATHSRILAWRIPWTEEPGGLQSTGLQRVGHDRGQQAEHTLPRRELQREMRTVHTERAGAEQGLSGGGCVHTERAGAERGLAWGGCVHTERQGLSGAWRGVGAKR